MNWFTFAEIKYLGELSGVAAVRTQGIAIGRDDRREFQRSFALAAEGAAAIAEEIERLWRADVGDLRRQR